MNGVVKSIRGISLAVVLLSSTSLFLWVDDRDRQSRSNVYRQVYQSILALGFLSDSVHWVDGLVGWERHKSYRTHSSSRSAHQISKHYPSLTDAFKDKDLLPVCNCDELRECRCRLPSPSPFDTANTENAELSLALLNKYYLNQLEQISFQCRKGYSYVENDSKVKVSIFDKAGDLHDRTRLPTPQTLQTNSLPVPADTLLIVQFDQLCGPYKGYDPVIILPATTLGGSISLVLPYWVIRYFRIDQVGRTGLDYDETLYGVSLEALTELVVSDAAFHSETNYERSAQGVMEAIEDMIGLRTEKPSVLGITVPHNRASFVFVIVYVALAFLFLHRCNRFSMSSDLTEPWILVSPLTILERFVAMIWMTALTLSALPIALIVIQLGINPGSFQGCQRALDRFPSYALDCAQGTLQWPTVLLAICLIGTSFIVIGLLKIRKS